MKDDRSDIISPALFAPDLMRSPNHKEQQISAKRIKRNDNMKGKSANSTTLGRPRSKINGSDIGNNDSHNNPKITSASSLPGNHTILCGKMPHNQTNHTSGGPTRGPCQSGFFYWKPITGREARNPCVKRITKTYLTGRKELVIEFECRRATFYCRQTSSGMGRCQPIKVLHTGLDKVLTVGCKCKA